MNIYLFFLVTLFQKNLGQPAQACDHDQIYFVNEEESTGYLFVNKLQTANEANSYCKSLGGELVQIATEKTLIKLREFSVNWLKKLGYRLEKVEIYGLAANAFVQRFISPLNKNIKYSSSQMQFNKYPVAFSGYIFLNYTQHMYQLWMHTKPNGEFNSVVSFCSYVYDIVVLGNLCPSKYEKNFQVYASVKPSSTENKVKIYLPKFSLGNIKSTPLLIEGFDDAQVSFDQTHFFIPDINIFIGAKSPLGTRVWIWSNGSLVDDFRYFVPLPNSIDCRQLILPLLYSHKKNFEQQDCSEFKAYPVCEFKVIGDFRQLSCSGTEAKVIWRLAKPISANSINEQLMLINITILERKIDSSAVNVFASQLYRFNVFNMAFKSLQHSVAVYELFWSLVIPQSVCKDTKLVPRNNFFLTSEDITTVPMLPNATVFSLSKSVHMCHFQIYKPEKPNALLFWEIVFNDKVLLKIENNANLSDLQFMSITVNFTEQKITTKKTVFVITANNCFGQSRNHVKGGCPPPKVIKPQKDRIGHITKVFKPLLVKPQKPVLSTFVLYLIVTFIGVVGGIFTGVLLSHYRFERVPVESSSNENDAASENEVISPANNKS